MDILVLIKGVIVPTQKPAFDEKGQLTAETSTAILNPYDKNAIEAALQLVDDHDGDVTVASYGVATTTEPALRAGLALGATKAVAIDSPLVATDKDNDSAIGVVLAEAARKLGQFDLILTGSQALDMPQGYVGALVANSLNLPYFDNVNALATVDDELVYTTLWEKGTITGKVQEPAVISVTDSINKPRLPSFKTKMMAKRAELEQLTIDSITVIDQSAWDDLNKQAPTSRLAPLPVQKKKSVVYQLDDDEAAVTKLITTLKAQSIL